jgi:hypothetical protein
MSNTNTKTKANRYRVLDYLKKHATISPMRALVEFGETRLAARVEELRNEGWLIETRMRTAESGRSYAEYLLTSHTQSSEPCPIWMRQRYYAAH